jgi:hypothetical protein
MQKVHLRSVPHLHGKVTYMQFLLQSDTVLEGQIICHFSLYMYSSTVLTQNLRAHRRTMKETLTQFMFSP